MPTSLEPVNGIFSINVLPPISFVFLNVYHFIGIKVKNLLHRIPVIENLNIT